LPAQLLAAKRCPNAGTKWFRDTHNRLGLKHCWFLDHTGWQFAENKTGRSRRHKEKAAAGERWLNLDLVFTNELGGPVDRHNLAQRNFRRILETAALLRIRLYGLRHTAATLALAAGVPIKVVSKMLGHTSAAFTMDVYCHVLPHMQEEAADKVERRLMEDEPDRGPQSRRRHTMGTQRIQ
jgi:integrase